MRCGTGILIVLTLVTLLSIPAAIAPADPGTEGYDCTITYNTVSDDVIVGNRAEPAPGFSITCQNNMQVAHQIVWWPPGGGGSTECGGIGGYRSYYLSAGETYSSSCSELFDRPGRYTYRVTVGLHPWSFMDVCDFLRVVRE